MNTKSALPSNSQRNYSNIRLCDQLDEMSNNSLLNEKVIDEWFDRILISLQDEINLRKKTSDSIIKHFKLSDKDSDVRRFSIGRCNQKGNPENYSIYDEFYIMNLPFPAEDLIFHMTQNGEIKSKFVEDEESYLYNFRLVLTTNKGPGKPIILHLEMKKQEEDKQEEDKSTCIIL